VEIIPNIATSESGYESACSTERIPDFLRLDLNEKI
jgi:hypothetical protein